GRDAVVSVRNGVGSDRGGRGGSGESGVFFYCVEMAGVGSETFADKPLQNFTSQFPHAGVVGESEFQVFEPAVVDVLSAAGAAGRFHGMAEFMIDQVVQKFPGNPVLIQGGMDTDQA